MAGEHKTGAIRDAVHRCHDSVLKALDERLAAIESPILSNRVAHEQLRRQVHSILDAVAAKLEPTGEVNDNGRLESNRLTVEIGASRALQGFHPRESLRAATALFSTALPILCEELSCFIKGKGTGLAHQVGVVLHIEIMERVGVGAVSYASFLLEKLHSSHFDERRRIARELHDRAAHMVGVGLQNLELHDVYRERDAEKAQAKLVAARSALQQSLRTIRQLSTELRDSAADGGLDQALGNYLATNVPPGVQARLSTGGDTELAPPEVREELYLVLREAVRNALLHAEAKEIRVNLHTTATLIHAVVADNGKGFDVEEAAARPSGSGLISMRERIELLGGTIAMRSSPRNGTTTEVRVPLLGVRL